MVLSLALFIPGFWAYFHLAPPGTAFKAVNFDPEMAYFASSLAVFKGQPYVFVHHPGTPLAVLGSALLALTYPFHGKAPFVAWSVQHPGIFMVMAHALLALASVACVLALGWMALSVRRASDAVLAAAVPASYFAFLPQSFVSTFYWSHNTLAFPAGALLLLGVLRALRRGRPPRARTAWMLGLGAGALAATQLYFATWAVGLAAAAAALALFRPAQRRPALAAALTVLAASVAGFVVCTLPILPAYPRLFAWVRALATHQGAYGAGPGGFTSFARWRANVAWLWDGSPALFIATAVVFAMLLAAFLARRARPIDDAGLWAAATGMSVQWAATLLLLAKHPSHSYLPAVAAMLPPLLAIAFLFLRRRNPGRRVCVGVAVVILLGSVRAGDRAVHAHAARIAYRTAMEEEVGQYLSRYAAARGVDRPSVLLLWGPLVPDAGCYGLWMGNEYTDRALRHEISLACPSQGLAWSNMTVLPEGWPSREPTPAVLITTEQAPRLFPAFAALGQPELSAVRDPAGVRLAFYRVSVADGVARPKVP